MINTYFGIAPSSIKQLRPLKLCKCQICVVTIKFCLFSFKYLLSPPPPSNFPSLLEGLEKKEITACTLGLAHSLSRYKLKFSPDKVDTMIIQAISLLDDLDKELNNYTMRLREWFGWHFPEMGKIVTDNIAFAKVRGAILLMVVHNFSHTK